MLPNATGRPQRPPGKRFRSFTIGPACRGPRRERYGSTASGKEGADIYRLSLYLMVGVLAAGFLANLFIRPVAQRFMQDEAEETRFTKDASREPARRSVARQEG